MILPVIMAGGSGTRLWPLSRQLFPKQFLTLNGDSSMLQATALRLAGIEHKAAGQSPARAGCAGCRDRNRSPERSGRRLREPWGEFRDNPPAAGAAAP